MLDIAMAIAVIGVLLVVSLDVYRPVPGRAAIAGLGTIAGELRNDAAVRQLHTGRWSVTSGLRDIVEDNDYIERIEREGARFVVVLSDRHPPLAGQRLAFRLARHPARPDASMIWLCGYAEPPTGYTVAGPNPTNVDREYLPNHCRGTRG